MVTLTKHIIPGPDLHCARPLVLSGFLQHLPAKFSEDQKSPTICVLGPGAVPYAKTALVIALRS